MTGQDRLRPLLYGCLAAVLGLLFSAAALALPGKFLPDARFFDSGLRLLRDEQEMGVYFERSRWFSEHGRPYNESYPQEYPPVGALFLTLPRLLTSGSAGYQAVFSVIASLLFGLQTGLTAMLLRRLRRSYALLWLLVLPAPLYFSIWRFDVLPAVLVSLAILAVLADRRAWAVPALIAGALAKFYPAFFLLPLFMSPSGGEKNVRPPSRRTITGAFAAAGGVLAAALLVFGIDSVLSPVLFHLGRPFEIGSLGDILLWSVGSAGVTPAIAQAILAALFLPLQFAPFIVLPAVGRLTDIRSFIRACLFLLLPFVLLNRFFSPQWVVWITPLVLLVADAGEVAALAVLGVAAYLQFPVVFGLDPFSWQYKVISAVVLAAIGWLTWRNIAAMLGAGTLVFRPGRGPRADRKAI